MNSQALAFFSYSYLSLIFVGHNMGFTNEMWFILCTI